MQEYYALRTAGLGVGKTNAYYINQAMKTIAIEYDAKSLRFWGKILGQRDYFVLQGTTNKQYLADLGDSAEKYGEGVNFYSYWVSSDVLGCWNELPLVTDRQMRASRDFKYVFTGDLEREVPQHPEFCGLGREKHLVSKGLFSLNAL